MINASIGKRIRKAREKRKMTQEAFAEKIGISETYVGMIERGERIGSVGRLSSRRSDRYGF